MMKTASTQWPRGGATSTGKQACPRFFFRTEGRNHTVPRHWDFRLWFSVSSVQSLSRVWLFATPWTAEHQASLSITNSWSLPKPLSIESVMPCNHFILCGPLLLPSTFPSIRVFATESALCIRWPKYWSFSLSISPFKEYSGFISFKIDWFDLLAV